MAMESPGNQRRKCHRRPHRTTLILSAAGEDISTLQSVPATKLTLSCSAGNLLLTAAPFTTRSCWPLMIIPEP